jgi:hypothetical protein
MHKNIFFSFLILLSFPNKIFASYSDDYGCEDSIILGTSYYTSWSPGSVTTGEGYCTSEDVDVDIAGVIAGTFVLMGAIWLVTPSYEENIYSNFINPYLSNSKIGVTFGVLPENYHVRLVMKNDFAFDKNNDDSILNFYKNHEYLISPIQIEFGYKF